MMQDTWSRANILELIDFYKKHESLWNVNSPEYKDKRLKDKSYDSLLFILQRFMPALTLAQVKRKIHCLRTQYRREQKEMSIRRLTATDEFYRPRLWCFEQLNFLNISGDAGGINESSTTIFYDNDDDKSNTGACITDNTCSNVLSSFYDSEMNRTSDEVTGRTLDDREMQDDNFLIIKSEVESLHENQNVESLLLGGSDFSDEFSSSITNEHDGVIIPSQSRHPISSSAAPSECLTTTADIKPSTSKGGQYNHRSKQKKLRLDEHEINSEEYSMSQDSPRTQTAKVTKLAPNFTTNAVVNNKFIEISLKDFRGKYLVMVFYPQNFMYVCPTELIAFNDSIHEFWHLNTEVIGISVDSTYSHLAWIKTARKSGGLGGLRFPLLSDIKKEISRDYGVLNEEEGVALRGLFIIDPKGIVCHASITDLPVGRSIPEILRLVKAFKFSSKHGVVCPANWEPKSLCIKPNPEDAETYFKKVYSK